MKPGGKIGGLSAPRPSGGKRLGYTGFGEVHLEEQAMQTAVQAKQQAQQTTSSQQSSTGGSALKSAVSAGSNTQAAGASAPSAKTPPKPRPVGSLKEELLKHPVQDVVQELKVFLDVNKLLNVNPDTDTPEEKAKKQQLLKRWNQLNEEQQAVAKKRYQEELQKKQLEEREQEQKKQEEEQAKQAQPLAPPVSVKKGPIGPAGSSRQRAVQQVKQQRQGIGRVQGMN